MQRIRSSKQSKDKAPDIFFSFLESVSTSIHPSTLQSIYNGVNHEHCILHPWSHFYEQVVHPISVLIYNVEQKEGLGGGGVDSANFPLNKLFLLVSHLIKVTLVFPLIAFPGLCFPVMPSCCVYRPLDSLSTLSSSLSVLSLARPRLLSCAWESSTLLPSVCLGHHPFLPCVGEEWGGNELWG